VVPDLRGHRARVVSIYNRIGIRLAILVAFFRASVEKALRQRFATLKRCRCYIVTCVIYGLPVIA
jgi:hypothetical protein